MINKSCVIDFFFSKPSSVLWKSATSQEDAIKEAWNTWIINTRADHWLRHLWWCHHQSRATSFSRFVNNTINRRLKKKSAHQTYSRINVDAVSTHFLLCTDAVIVAPGEDGRGLAFWDRSHMALVSNNLNHGADYNDLGYTW